jgi:hypothetical protein
MAPDDSMARTISAVTERAAKEQDPHQLVEAVLAINILLAVIERRAAEIERSDSHTRN